MATAIMDSAYSPPSPAGHSPDTTSPIYPDRPIRPLPRRPLRSRLSPEIADSILYPPVPHVSKPLFYHSYNDTGYYDNSTNVNAEIREIDRALTEAQKASNGINSHSYQFKGNDVDSGEEDGLGIVRRHDSQRQVLESTPSRTFVNGSSRVEGPPARSTVSSNDSVDGYDSFENTNNKKKRKIPTSGISTGHHSTLSAEMASMGISPSHDGDLSHLASEGGVGQYYGSGSSAIPAGISGTGISGAGRGRYGRSGARTASGRSPLGVSINGSNAWQVGRTGTQRREWASVALPKGKEMIYDQPPDHGIISAAIANAAALPATPSKGQENISLLDQQAAKKNTPAKTQFTFTCESDSTKAMLWPNDQSTSADGHYLNGASPNGQNNLPPHQGQKGFSTQGTQTSPTMASQANQNGVQQPGAGQQLAQGKKLRRPPGRRYTIAAYERRKQQETNNRHHPPKEEDVWICEFCEYESIFGYPPEALIRQYEIKDRRERKRLAEKRRLLEKAKMKGRKGKKGNKNAAKNANMGAQSQHAASPQNYGQQSSDQTPVQNQGTQSEEYFGDDYDDDPVPMPAPSFQTPTKIPQPIASTTGQSMRSVRPGGSGHIRDGAIGIAA